MNELTVPTVHLNGSSEEMLLDQYKGAITGLRRAIGALMSMSPHERDYYTQDAPDAWKTAFDQHRRRVDAVQEICDEVEGLHFRVATGCVTSFLVKNCGRKVADG